MIRITLLDEHGNPLPPAPWRMRRRPDTISSRRFVDEQGTEVLVLARWAGGGPQHVLAERADGARCVRPFVGLRRVR